MSVNPDYLEKHRYTKQKHFAHCTVCGFTHDDGNHQTGEEIEAEAYARGRKDEKADVLTLIAKYRAMPVKDEDRDPPHEAMRASLIRTINRGTHVRRKK